MLIIGIFMASGLRALYIYNQHQAYKHDKRAMISITLALNGFLASNGRYPCPARLDDDRSNASYGLETDCTDTASVSIGQCQDGICVEESLNPALPANTRVRRGAVPFRILNIVEEDAYDGFDSKIEYAVTESLAQDGNFNSREGGISVTDSNGFSVIQPEHTAHFVVLSHGENKLGAYSPLGSQDIACAGVGSDIENCNTTTDSNAVYVSDLKSKTGAANNFDDTLTYRVTAEPPMWRKTDTTGLHITDLTDALGGVGARLEPSDDTGAGGGPKLDVFGDLRARDDLLLDNVCDENDSACFAPEIIGGDPPPGQSLRCPTGFATGISFNSMDCANNLENSCPPGSYMRGIDADGRPVCYDPPNSCPSSTTRTLCAGLPGEQTYTLPGGVVHNTQSVPWPLTGGTSYREWWRCRDGSWRRTGRSGSCTCTPTTQTRTRSCPTGFSGSIIQERTRSCPSGSWSSWSTTVNGCGCAGTSETQTRSCPDGFTGSESRTRTFTCSDPNNGSWGSWSGWGGTCTCVPDSVSSQLYCPVGFSGTGDYREKYFNCPAGTWDADWTVVTPGNCTCSPVTQTRTVACPDGEVGEIIETRSSVCPGGGWTEWAYSSGACEMDVCKWQPATASSSITGPPGIGDKANTTCVCGIGNSPCWESAGDLLYKNYPSCACVSQFE